MSQNQGGEILWRRLQAAALILGGRETKLERPKSPFVASRIFQRIKSGTTVEHRLQHCATSRLRSYSASENMP
jgi:hypothetical protein